jgi:circadian clock protein KaiB
MHAPCTSRGHAPAVVATTAVERHLPPVALTYVRPRPPLLLGEAVRTWPSLPMDALHLTLYVAGDTPRSRQAMANLQRICAELLGGRAECATVDVLDSPELADAERILTTPTLVRESPSPRRRVTGDLSDAQRVMTALGFTSPDQ